MSNVVQFLEDLARNPNTLSTEDLAAALAKAKLDAASQQALLNRDAAALNELLGGRLKMVCMIAPAENDEPQQEEEQEGDDEAPESETSRAA